MNMCTLTKFFQCQLCAEWTVAGGTLILAFTTFIIHLMGDKTTRLFNQKINYDFQRRAYNFLRETFSSGRLKDETTSSSQKLTVEDNINKFYQDVIDNRIYLTWLNGRKFKKYVQIANMLATAWDTWPNDNVNKCQKLVLNEMKKLSKSIGKEKDMEDFKRQYPNLYS